jgi:quercetin dioxygenase-like cupin family protein
MDAKSRAGASDAHDKVQIVDADDSCPALPIVEEGGQARAVIWPGIGARERSMHLIELAPGGRTIPMRHPMEAVYYVISGAARATDLSDDAVQEAVVGSMIFVEPDTRYVISADGEGASLVGGPCPPDPALYAGLADD